MVKDWQIREEIYSALHQWPTITVFILIGCLLGWIGSYIWPNSYRATTLIYVGLNPYRAYSDSTFLALASPKYSNIDDYKHWQMSQLNGAIYLEAFITDTLTELRKNDPYWQAIDPEQLWRMLDADWRTAGAWSLIARHQDANYASQASEAWAMVVVDHVSEAVQSARDAFMIDEQLQEITAELFQTEQRLATLTLTKERLQEWQQEAKNLPPDQPLAPVERWQILSLVGQATTFDPVWMMLLEKQPAGEALPAAYLEWLEQIMVNIDVELDNLLQHIEILAQEQADLAAQYASQSDASLGFSSNITIEGRETLPADPVRPGSLFTLTGGVIGLLVWGLVQLVKITKRESSSENAELE